MEALEGRQEAKPAKPIEGSRTAKSVKSIEGNPPVTSESIKGGSKTIEDLIGNLPETTNGKGVDRPDSKTGGATLEIRVSNSKVYKIRY